MTEWEKEEAQMKKDKEITRPEFFVPEPGGRASYNKGDNGIDMFYNTGGMTSACRQS